MAEQLTACPHCGSDCGFYRKGTVSGTYVYHYDFNGETSDNTHLHDGIRYHEQVSCYCSDCNKKLKMKHPKNF